MNEQTLAPETNEEEYKEDNEIIDKNNFNQIITDNAPEEKIEKIPEVESKDFIIYLEENKDSKFCLNLCYDSNYFYFKLRKKEPVDISLFFYFNKLDYSTLVDKLALDGSKYSDFKSIDEIIKENLNKNEIFLKKAEKENLDMVIKLKDNYKNIVLYKREMNEDEKFEKILKELKDLKNINDDKIEELKKSAKEIEEFAEKKCQENKTELESLQLQVDQNTADIENETNEIELLKEEIDKIKSEIKENEDKTGNKKDCSVF